MPKRFCADGVAFLFGAATLAEDAYGTRRAYVLEFQGRLFPDAAQQLFCAHGGRGQKVVVSPGVFQGPGQWGVFEHLFVLHAAFSGVRELDATTGDDSHVLPLGQTHRQPSRFGNPVACMFSRVHEGQLAPGWRTIVLISVLSASARA